MEVIYHFGVRNPVQEVALSENDFKTISSTSNNEAGGDLSEVILLYLIQVKMLYVCRVRIGEKR